MEVQVITTAYLFVVTACVGLLFFRFQSRPIAAWYHFIFLLFYGPAFFFYWSDDGGSTAQFRSAGVLLLSLSVTMLVSLVFFFRSRKEPKLPSQLQTNVEPSRLVFSVSAVVVIVVTILGLSFGGQLHRLKEGYSLTSRDRDSGYYHALRTDHDLMGGNQLSVRLLEYVSRHGVGPFLAILAIALWRTKRSNETLLFAISLFLCVLLAKASTLKKMDAVFFMTQCGMIVAICSSRDERQKATMVLKLVIVGVLGTSGLGLTYIFFTNANNVLQILNNIRIRIFEIPNYCLEQYVTWYPDRIPFQDGMNIRILHNLLGRGGEYQPAHSLINDGVGTANAIYVADAWVDWGWTGVLVFSLCVAGVLIWTEKTFLVQKSALNIAVLVFMLDPVKALISTSFITCAGGFGLVTVPLFAKYGLRQKKRIRSSVQGPGTK